MTEGLVRALAASLAIWPGLFLLLGGFGKMLDLRGDTARGTIAAKIVPGRISLRFVWALIAALELVVGALVLAAVIPPWPAVVAALLLVGAGVTALWGLRHAPESNCGCFGGLAAQRVKKETAIRAFVLAGLSAIAAGSGEGWTSAFDHPVSLLFTAAVGYGMYRLSPDLPDVWDSMRYEASLRSRRYRWWHEQRRQAQCEKSDVPLDRSIDRLQETDLWHRARPFISGEAPTEHWEEGCWRLITYPAVYGGEQATAVFKVSLLRRQGGNGVVFVNENEQKILGRMEAREEDGSFRR